MTSSELIATYFDALERLDLEAYSAAWAEEGVQEMPFAPPGMPRFFRGRESLRTQYAKMFERFQSVDYSDLRIHETTNPEIAIAEYKGSIQLKDGNRYDNEYVTIFQFRNGEIVHRSEYYNPLIWMESFPERGI